MCKLKWIFFSREKIDQSYTWHKRIKPEPIPTESAPGSRSKNTQQRKRTSDEFTSGFIRLLEMLLKASIRRIVHWPTIMQGKYTRPMKSFIKIKHSLFDRCWICTNQSSFKASRLESWMKSIDAKKNSPIFFLILVLKIISLLCYSSRSYCSSWKKIRKRSDCYSNQWNFSCVIINPHRKSSQLIHLRLKSSYWN